MEGSTNNVIMMILLRTPPSIKNFDGSKTSDFREWSENTAMVLSTNRPDIVLVLEGLPKLPGSTLDGGGGNGGFSFAGDSRCDRGSFEPRPSRRSVPVDLEIGTTARAQAQILAHRHQRRRMHKHYPRKHAALCGSICEIRVCPKVRTRTTTSQRQI